MKRQVTASLILFAIAVIPTCFAQEKISAGASKVVRLNRAPVNKDVLHVQLPRPTVVKLPNG